jgi:hypothetical protein
MVYVRYQKFGKQEYAYEITSYWDKKTKTPKQKSRYLGVVVDRKRKIFERRAQIKNAEQLILDYGDSFVIQKFLEQTGFTKLLENAFGNETQTLQALITYKLCYGSAWMYAKPWFEGNYARLAYPQADVSSQRVSEFFKRFSNEGLQQSFFSKYIPTLSTGDSGIIIDCTSLPNQIHVPLTAWGLCGEEIDKQARFLLVVDEKSKSPLYFRTLPGNIIDVSTLSNTIKELKQYGVKKAFTFLDAGFFSECNIKELYAEGMHFVTRLPAQRLLYKELVAAYSKSLEAYSNIVRYGERGLFVKQVEVELFGSKAFAYLVLDPKRKGREVDRLIVQNIDEKDKNNSELEYLLSTRGLMILVSSFPIPKTDVVQTYYLRQNAEVLFGFSKDDLSLLPLRVHSENSLRGFLFMQFLTLIAFTQLKRKLGDAYTVEEVLVTMRNLKCKRFSNDLVVGEFTRKQKEIVEKLGIIMTNTSGI